MYKRIKILGVGAGKLAEDGRTLVPYQCVVRRSDWETVRSRALA